MRSDAVYLRLILKERLEFLHREIEALDEPNRTLPTLHC